ncbi:hypothetical protein SAMN04488515_0679 [Cognatiyoonia koreensis]|uniref:Lipoprotein n=1 Tax=Cognatiyoonia koreensis TaxID=364200 RepID=A0A1I0NLA2_9RHOB|nr:hypothetical protein [Cognatiyoonia koreensis]SEW01960.1 hypothetical protein SAMN04488515_0679 [Cognatiyoonia koreensis]
MKKLLPLVLIGLAGCLEPPVPGFEFNENVQAVDDSLPGGVTFVQNIPYIAVTRVNEAPLTANDLNLALTATRQFCGSKGGTFSGRGVDLTLGLPTFRDGAWLIAGECRAPQPLVTAAAPATTSAE